MSKQKSIIRQTFLNSVISIIIAATAVLLGVVIDGIIIGRYLGPSDMASYTLMTPLISMITAVSGVLSTGVQVICAERIGEGDIRGARQAFSVCMTGTLVISLAITVAAVFFRSDIASFLGASGNSESLLPASSDYLLGLALACPASIFLFEFNSIIRLDGGSIRIIAAVAVMTLLDVAGDLLNVFVFKGGMLGMGLATSVSYLIALIIMGLHFTRKDIIFRFSFRGMKIRDFKDILVTGAPSAVGAVSTALRTYVHNIIMAGTLSAVSAVSAFGVINTVFNFTSCILIGVAITTSMIAGMILGEQDRSSARQLMRTALRTALQTGVFLFLLIFVFAGPIASVFGGKDGASMVSLASRGLRFYSVSLLIFGINSIFTNYLQGMRRMAYSLIFSFLHTFLFTGLTALALAGRFGTDAVWISFALGELFTLLSFCALAGILKHGIPHRIDDFLFLPEPFGPPESRIFDITVTGISGVAPACVEAAEFAAAKGASEEQAALILKYAEQIGNRMAGKGFDKEKDQLLEIRVENRDNGWIMRLRDNCRPCDPTKELDLEGASAVDYVNTLDLNIVTVRL